VGANAASLAARMGAIVHVVEIIPGRLHYLHDTLPANVVTHYSTPLKVRELLSRADLVIGAVLIPGARAPRLIEKADLALMKPGAVFVDVAIDQGGCAESSRPTTHDAATYVVNRVVHYCVTNMPGAVGRTSSQALCNATLPYVERIAGLGIEAAARKDPGLAQGINVRAGQVAHRGVAEALGLECCPTACQPGAAAVIPVRHTVGSAGQRE
jgi:alanine dehydrogenase